MLSVIVLQGLLLAASAAVAATTTTSAPEDVDDRFGRLRAHSEPHCSIWRAYHGGAHEINDLMAALERNKTYEYKPIEIDVYAHTIVKSSASPRSKVKSLLPHLSPSSFIQFPCLLR